MKSEDQPVAKDVDGIMRSILSALHFAEFRYRSMWFGGPKPVTNVRGELESIKGAIALASAAIAASEGK